MTELSTGRYELGLNKDTSFMNPAVICQHLLFVLYFGAMCLKKEI